MATLTVDAIEKSTYVVTLAFTDASGASVTPSSATWTLTDTFGVVINSRSAVAITPLAASVSVVLSGLDLALLPAETTQGVRLLTVNAVYTSTEGAGLTLKEEYSFRVRNLTAVT